jgi:hypothetical protein
MSAAITLDMARYGIKLGQTSKVQPKRSSRTLFEQIGQRLSGSLVQATWGMELDRLMARTTEVLSLL